jgi:hypothetical protein
MGSLRLRLDRGAIWASIMAITVMLLNAASVVAGTGTGPWPK